MKLTAISAAEAVQLQFSAAIAGAIAGLTEDDPDDGAHVVPGAIRRALAELRLLHSVPFNYLVADASLLPRESVRFFYIDRNWTDALIAGVLSIGTFTTAERAQLEALREVIRDEVDEAERTIRMPKDEARLSAAGGAVSGFLLRSKLVSGWPGLHVRGYAVDRQADDDILPESDPDRLKVLRMERLAPAVLLVLFDGVPAVVHVEEPRQGIQFGALRPPAEPLSTRRTVPLRDAATGDDLPNQSVDVPFRRGSAGVIHLRKLRNRIAAKPATHVGGNTGMSVDANEFALEMLRFPYRQVFGDPANEPGHALADVFRPRLAFGELEDRFRDVIQ
ncbi:hypothetical protein [Mycolicibacterium stellerae]|uniref:hypothetical protein n=1 Tax=Mycolicibacterium stellerae TaxID=2358193 RepID=UPI000F0B74D6|nr:hypothetical protein [Mycolicibacterium stellerae]